MVFEDFVVPDPVVLVPLLVATGAVGLMLHAFRPRVSQGVVLAFVPWMALGALLHVLYQMDRAADASVVPGEIAVVLSAPSVYLTTFVLLGVVWMLSVMFIPSGDRTALVARRIATAGVVLLLALTGYAAWEATAQFAVDPILPLFGLLGSLLLTALLYVLVGFWRPYAVNHARYVGFLVLFAHVFDGVTTAIGIELLDAGERSTAPQFILDVAADLPTADILGEAWLFVLVKVVVAIAIIVLFHDYLRDHPTEGNLFFAVIAAVGLGPGAHNFFLFTFGVAG